MIKVAAQLHLSIHVQRSLDSTQTWPLKKGCGTLWWFLNNPKTPSELRPLLSLPNQMPRFTTLFVAYYPKQHRSMNREELLHSDFTDLCRFVLCFPHKSLYNTVTSLSRAFYFGLGLIFYFYFFGNSLQCCKARRSSTALLNKCLYLSFLCAAGILVSKDSYFVYVLLVLHETSGTLIFFFFFLMYYRWKKWKDEPLDQWFRWHLFVYLSLASSILILLILSLYCIYAFSRNLKKFLRYVMIPQKDFFCSKQDQNLQINKEKWKLM